MENLRKCENFTADLADVHEHGVLELVNIYAISFIDSAWFHLCVHLS